MRLADFIQSHHEAILIEWEAFARTLKPAAEGMSKAGLRDHADEILTAIVDDMVTLESPGETSEKSKGKAKANGKAKSNGKAKKGRAAPEKTSKGPAALGHPGSLGKLHALLRIESGFTLRQVVAEYRALRASVFRLWEKARPADPAGVQRFNEAIDSALAEAVDRYTEKTNEYRDQLIGIVSHDLRNPLGGILMASTMLTDAEGLDDRSARMAARIQNSAKRMVRIVGDLLDLTRSRLGSEIHIVRGPTDVGEVCQMVISELEGSHPSAVLHYESIGDLRGEWDSDRLAQVLSNLVGNALQHGDTGKPISVDARADGKEIVVTVHNAGAPIPKSMLGNVFEPMVRHLPGEGKQASAGLGLGLFIAKELVTAHAGTIEVTSTAADGTTFTVRLPRHPPRSP